MSRTKEEQFSGRLTRNSRNETFTAMPREFLDTEVKPAYQQGEAGTLGFAATFRINPARAVQAAAPRAQPLWGYA
jgi:hypothetical protein